MPFRAEPPPPTEIPISDADVEIFEARDSPTPLDDGPSEMDPPEISIYLVSPPPAPDFNSDPTILPTDLVSDHVLSFSLVNCTPPPPPDFDSDDDPPSLPPLIESDSPDEDGWDAATQLYGGEMADEMSPYQQAVNDDSD
jgi:hypothetical protein